MNKVGWSGGLAQWDEGGVKYVSVAFTWLVGEAYEIARFAYECGQKVVVGGPALYLRSMKERFAGVAEVGGALADAVRYHNGLATFASRGCPVGCWFCIVPKLEGRSFTLLPDFPVRPILCDNNLSALPGEYQDHIVSRYVKEGVPLLDANSGFEPRTFDEEVFRRWKGVLKGPWRFAYDDMQESGEVEAVMRMLRDEPQKRKRVYVLIGNEPYRECMERIQSVIAHGCEPHVQPFIKLNALAREPFAKHDWSVQRLKDVARWANGWLWKQFPFEEYVRHRKKPVERYDAEQGLFV